MAAKRRPVSQPAAATLRIIGGSLKGSKILYPGEPSTRPMKDRVREAVFNLVGDAVKSTTAIDLFAGTGAIALEAVSRGANFAVAIEKHFRMAGTIKTKRASAGRCRSRSGACWRCVHLEPGSCGQNDRRLG